MLKRVNRIGEKHITLQGYEVEIVEYFHRLNCTVKFEDGLTLKGLRYPHIVNGYVKNPNHKSVYGVGYLGIGEYSTCENYKRTPAYKTWNSMMHRCYKQDVLKHTSYKNVIVCEEWHSLQGFSKWHEDNYEQHMIGWHLDKDILVKGNKVYSPETCCFVPQVINKLLVKADSTRGEYPIGVYYSERDKKFLATLCKLNMRIHLGTFDTSEEAFQAYKVAKEKHIKETADEWREQITTLCYQALYNYQVEITD